jgi:hypothetical protein
MAVNYVKFCQHAVAEFHTILLQTSLIGFVISIKIFAWMPTMYATEQHTSNLAMGTSLICLAADIQEFPPWNMANRKLTHSS